MNHSKGRSDGEWECEDVFFFLLSQGSIFNNSLSGLIKHLKQTPRRGRLYWRERDLSMNHLR